MTDVVATAGSVVVALIIGIAAVVIVAGVTYRR